MWQGENSNEIIFREYLHQKDFRNKVINFYKSQKIKNFIRDCCESEDEEKLLEKLSHLIELLEKDDFWNTIMFYPLSKNIMAFVSNYLRVVVNTHYIKFIRCSSNDEKIILKFILFVLLIHEFFHLLRRFKCAGIKATDALTPAKENESHGEIGQRLIEYFFTQKKIPFVTLEAAEYFDKLNLAEETDIENLATIVKKMNEESLSNQPMSRFLESGQRGSLFEMPDCRYLIVSKFTC